MTTRYARRARLHRHRHRLRDHDPELTGRKLERHVARLEQYQRDLEQEAADVAATIKRLRERAAG